GRSEGSSWDSDSISDPRARSVNRGYGGNGFTNGGTEERRTNGGVSRRNASESPIGFDARAGEAGPPRSRTSTARTSRLPIDRDSFLPTTPGCRAATRRVSIPRRRSSVPLFLHVWFLHGVSTHGTDSTDHT